MSFPATDLRSGQEGAPPKKKRGPRQDVKRNKAAILAAAGELLLENVDAATMQSIADRAGLHVATLYRYYPTIDELHRDYLISLMEELIAYADSLELEGVGFFEAVLGRWLDLVSRYGAAMVLLRSREGYLARRQRGERHAATLEQAWGKAVKELMRVDHVDGSLYEYALALRNSMLNSRELVDLLALTKRSPARLVHDLTSIYRGALRGLAGTTYP